MKNMSQAKEFADAIPAGRYKMQCVEGEAGTSNKGQPMITLTWNVIEGPHKGSEVNDYLITDGSADGAGIARRKLRDLGFKEVDSDVEIPDDTIVERLLGREAWVEIGNDQRMKKGVDGKYNVPVFNTVNGQNVPVMNANVQGYVTNPAVAAATTPAPTQAAAAPAPAPAPATGAPAFAGPGLAAPPWIAGQQAAQAAPNGAQPAAPAQAAAPATGGRKRSLRAPAA